MRATILTLLSICSAAAYTRKQDYDEYDTGKKEVEIDDSYPYLVKILGKTTCAGVMFNWDIVVTSASCAQGRPEDYTGVAVFDQAKPNEAPRINKVIDVVAHPDYSREPFSHDIGMIRIDISKGYPPLKSFYVAEDSKFTAEGKELTIINWTETKEGENELNKNVHVDYITVKNTATCESKNSQMYPKSLFCADYSQRYGLLHAYYTGAPVFHDHPRGKFLAGIYTRNHTGEYEFLPGEFTRVFNFKRWIVETSRDLQTDW